MPPGSIHQPWRRALEKHYHSEGFLAADVSVGPAETRDGASVVSIKVIEGRPFSIGDVVLGGLPEGLEKEGRDALAFTSGARYRPADVAAGIDRLETQLRRAAYRTASTDVETRIEEKTAQVNVTVQVTPGARSILQDVVVEGADAGKPAIARSIALKTGAPLDPATIRETRRRLYDLEVYRSVDIQVQPLAAGAPPEPATVPAEQPVMARITLEERPRYRVRYGLAVSDEEIGTDERDRRLGFAADVENRNIFGRGATAGVSVRLRRDQQVGRLTLGSQRFFGLPLRSTVFIERQREQLNPEGAFPITSDISGLTAEQAYRLRRAIELRYGYGTERNHTFIRTDEPDAFDLTVRIARFTTSGLIDRRDDAFNPVRGWFAASTLELSRPGIGSDLSFLKDFAQYSHFVPLGRGVVVASGARLGVARTFDDEVLIPSERFYAGGANSVRGYREDDLGARSIFDDAEGGSALLVTQRRAAFPDLPLAERRGIRRSGKRLSEDERHLVRRPPDRRRRRRAPRYAVRPHSIRSWCSSQPPIFRSSMADSRGTGARVLTIINSQLPTSNSQGKPIEQWGESHTNQLVWSPFTRCSKAFTWELGVGRSVFSGSVYRRDAFGGSAAPMGVGAVSSVTSTSVASRPR